MALPVIFGPLTAAQMSELDTDFAAVGALTTIRNSATGTNSIVLTPAANQPAVTGYGLPNPCKFSFTAPATTTGAVTLEILSLGFLPVYTPNGVQATTGTLVSGNYYEVTYTTGAIYNSGAGAWVLSSYQSGTGLVVLAGSSVRGLKAANNSGTPSTQIDISFQQGCLVNASGTPTFLGSLSATIDLTTGTVTSTANGMDGESRPASGWVYIYAISQGSGMAGLGTTTSPLAGPPTLPAGYAYYAYLGAMRCDGSSNLLRTKQLGNHSTFTVVAATNTAALPVVLAAGSAPVGAFTAGALASTSIAAFVPPTASVFDFAANMQSASASLALGGDNNYGASTSSTNPIPFLTQGFSAQVTIVPGSIVLETAQIIFAAMTGSLNGLFARGWTDYVSAAGGG